MSGQYLENLTDIKGRNEGAKTWLTPSPAADPDANLGDQQRRHPDNPPSCSGHEWSAEPSPENQGSPESSSEGSPKNQGSPEGSPEPSYEP